MKKEHLILLLFLFMLSCTKDDPVVIVDSNNQNDTIIILNDTIKPKPWEAKYDLDLDFDLIADVTFNVQISLIGSEAIASTKIIPYNGFAIAISKSYATTTTIDAYHVTKDSGIIKKNYQT